MDKVEKYLQEGEVTQITPLVKEIAGQIPGKGKSFIKNFFNWIMDSGYFQKTPKEKKRKLLDTHHLQRTVDQVLKSRLCIACGEKTAVFITLCRSRNIPAKYVEAVALDWLKQEGEENMHSHAFGEVYLNNHWHLVDPERMAIYPERNYQKLGYAKWAEGIDFRDLTDQEGKKHSWQNLDELKKDTLIFKTEWKKKNS